MITSISGYTASDDHGILHPAPKFYQSKSMLEAQFRADPGRSHQGGAPSEFTNYAKAHAYPNDTPSICTSAVRPPDVPRLPCDPTNLSSDRPSDLSPTLQAAAQSLSPISTYENTIPPIAETRPSTAVAASVPLPGPRELIQAIARTKTRQGANGPLGFGATTKIVPLPVTTTRPLPLVDSQRSRRPPPVILTSAEYSLGGPPMKRYAKSTHAVQHPLMSISTATGGSGSSTASYSFPSASPAAPTNTRLGPFEIPPGFTSVNPPGRSFIAKKQQGWSEETSKQCYNTDRVPVFPQGFTSVNPSGRTYSEKRKHQVSSEPSSQKPTKSTGNPVLQQQNTGGSIYDLAPFSLADLQNSVITISNPAHPKKRPRGRPLGSKSKTKQEKTDQSLRDLSQLSDIESEVDDDDKDAADRPAICSFNPVHPLHKERLQKGEITAEVICDKRFRRKSDCVRHERIHCNDRPFACTVLGCGKRFIQRSALTVHERTHTGERPHICDVCLKKFTDSSSLTRHRRLHLSDKPYRCTAPDCTQSFTRKLSLSKHYHSSHSDLPLPTELSFVFKTQKQDGLPLVGDASEWPQMETEGSESDLTVLETSSNEDHSAGAEQSRLIFEKEPEIIDGKHVKRYEDVSSDAKLVRVYPAKAGSAEAKATRTTNTIGESSRIVDSRMKRKLDTTDFGYTAVDAKTARQDSPGFVISASRSRGFETSAGPGSRLHADNGRPVPPQYPRKTEKRNTNRYMNFSGSREEIALPIDAIYGLMTPRSTPTSALPQQNMQMPTAYPMSFTAPDPVADYPLRNSPEQPLYYSAIPTNGPHGPMMMMHPVFQKPHNVASGTTPSTAPSAKSTPSYRHASPIIIETGRSRLQGYRMKTPMQIETERITVPADTRAPRQKNRHPAPAPTPLKTPRICIEINDRDDVPMDVNREATNTRGNNESDLKRVRPLDIPSGKPWSLSSGVQVSEVRTSLEVLQSRDSAATLVGSPSESTVLKGVGAAGGKDGE